MRTETMAALRAQVAVLERGSSAGPVPSRLPLGIPELDARLPGQGLALGAMHELFAGGPAAGHGAAPALFAAAALARRTGPVLWIAARCDFYPPALARVGLDPARLVFVRTRRGALRAMEEGLRHPGLTGVVCEHEGRLDLVASRRLQLAAEATDVLGFTLRRSPRFDDPALRAPSAAATRWRIASVPSPPPLPHAPDVPGLGRPLWRLELLRYRVAPVESDVPERAVLAIPPLAPSDGRGWTTPWPRPARLLPWPEPVDAVGLLPDHLPRVFTWRRVRRRVMRADGPERITGEWWRRSSERVAVRDYWAVEDENGCRFWLFRQGDGLDPATGGLAWFLHGFF